MDKIKYLEKFGYKIIASCSKDFGLPDIFILMKDDVEMDRIQTTHMQGAIDHFFYSAKALRYE